MKRRHAAVVLGFLAARSLGSLIVSMVISAGLMLGYNRGIILPGAYRSTPLPLFSATVAGVVPSLLSRSTLEPLEETSRRRVGRNANALALLWVAVYCLAAGVAMRHVVILGLCLFLVLSLSAIGIVIARLSSQGNAQVCVGAIGLITGHGVGTDLIPPDVITPTWSSPALIMATAALVFSLWFGRVGRRLNRR